MLDANFLNLGGVVLCALVGLKVLTTVADGLRRSAANRKYFRLRQKQLEFELAKLANATPTETLAWEGYRKFRIESIEEEALDCRSLYLVPHDDQPLPTFHPGQFLTFSVRVPGISKPLVRCYSLSDAPSSKLYRCTIKKVRSPSSSDETGKVSTYFTDVAQVGDILDIKAPKGSFCLDNAPQRPVVLVAAGVGVTPMMSMLKSIAKQHPYLETHAILGFRNSLEQPFKEELAAIRQDSNISVHIAYSSPLPADNPSQDFDSQGRISKDLLRKLLPSSNFQFFLCGPPNFMSSLHTELLDWGVPGDDIHSEQFGPASISWTKSVESEATSVMTPVSVCFARSGISTVWDEPHASLLDLADLKHVAIDSGCRAGNCGSCLVAVKRGRVNYLQTPQVRVDEGSCLACIATPATEVELDA